MGGAEDLPKRASSPLKRPASDLEPEDASSQKEDVDMIAVPPSDPPESAEPSTQSSRTRRAQSVNMLENEVESATSNESSEDQAQALAPPKSLESGM
jgi:ubiquitin carboxyl-terminal hydrolase 4/11